MYWFFSTILFGRSFIQADKVQSNQFWNEKKIRDKKNRMDAILNDALQIELKYIELIFL